MCPLECGTAVRTSSESHSKQGLILPQVFMLLLPDATQELGTACLLRTLSLGGMGVMHHVQWSLYCPCCASQSMKLLGSV